MKQEQERRGRTASAADVFRKQVSRASGHHVPRPPGWCTAYSPTATCQGMHTVTAFAPCDLATSRPVPCNVVVRDPLLIGPKFPGGAAGGDWEAAASQGACRVAAVGPSSQAVVGILVRLRPPVQPLPTWAALPVAAWAPRPGYCPFPTALAAQARRWVAVGRNG